ncbi:MAG: CDGSH iron-sulfur domain-containing protein [Nocardioidaceae bacterium]|jgi:CDGSH-type Zn-finger protein|nr:CDGSH iron-sulfur domain-containing protein [Nocardioidaceae bacterium]
MTAAAGGRRGDSDVEVTLCPGGPMLLRGASHVVGEDGARHEVQRSVVAVCRCGSSARAPWCDGTHKLLA